MKKALGPILGIILIILLASPWFVGKQVQTFYTQATDEMVQNNPTITLTDVDYQRGWFSSTITGSMGFKSVSQDIEPPFQLRYTSEITHGPIFWGKVSTGLAFDSTIIQIDGIEDEELSTLLKELPSFEVDSLVGFNKRISSVFSMASYAKTFDNKVKPLSIDFAGVNGNSDFNWETKDFTFKMQVPSFTVSEGKTMKSSITDLMLSAYKKAGDSNARYDIAKIVVLSSDEDIHFYLDKSYIVAGTTEVGDVYNMVLESGFEDLEVDARDFSAAKLKLVFDNIDKQSVETLQDTINEAASNADGMTSDMYGMVILSKASELLPELLKRSPKMTLETLTLGTGNNETLTATGYAEVLGDKAENLPLMALAQAMDIRLDANIPKTFLSSIVDLNVLMRLMDQGILVAKDQFYTLEAMFTEGHLTLNGKAMM